MPAVVSCSCCTPSLPVHQLDWRLSANYTMSCCTPSATAPPARCAPLPLLPPRAPFRAVAVTPATDGPRRGRSKPRTLRLTFA
eukprot:365123-Chlamydomonas_euryale.AAC.48